MVVSTKKFSVEKYIDEHRRIVDDELRRILPPENPADLLVSAIRYSVLAPGKRIRPILMLAVANLLGVPQRGILPTACAIELLHTYTLIHDDLPSMDNDEYRRGQPTTHKKYGEATAILAGDALQALAFEVIVRDTDRALVSAESLLAIIQEIAEAIGIFGVVGGQQLDLQFAEKPAGVEELREVHRRKTSALFRAAIRSAAILSGVSQADLARLTRFSEHFGLAFQLWDDIADVVHPAGERGVNFPILVGMEESRVVLQREKVAADQALQGLPGDHQALLGIMNFLVEP